MRQVSRNQKETLKSMQNEDNNKPKVYLCFSGGRKVSLLGPKASSLSQPLDPT